jgi:membrane protease YdiL (CAAX protease family)
MGVFGYPNAFGVDAHLYGAAMGAIIVVYALGEEIGWRGYLNDALKPGGYLLRVVVTGAMWWVWHLWFLSGSMETGLSLSADWQHLAGTFVGLLAASALFVAMIDESRSLMEVAAFHAVGNIAVFAGSVDLPQQQRLIIAAVILVALIALHTLWKRRSRI